MRIRPERGQREFAYARLCAKQNQENKKLAVFRRRLGGDEKSKCPSESSIKKHSYEMWTTRLGRPILLQAASGYALRALEQDQFLTPLLGTLT
jgi:hypothetical protein